MCEGLIVTSYSRADNQRDLDKYISLVGKDYDNYKTFVKYPASIKGWTIINKKKVLLSITDHAWSNKLRLVRIYFDTPTFDRIIKDRSAKFVDMLSAIGGTMGLLTGFSIISAVEIIYFATKIIFGCTKNK